MRVVSAEERELFKQLTELAGGSLLLQEVLEDLRSRYARPPKLEEVVEEIVRRRESLEPQPGAVAAGGNG